ncbi:MAG: sulfatase, partial [Candidatus Binatia bacterium]
AVGLSLLSAFALGWLRADGPPPAGATTGEAAPGVRRPNVVLIVLDTQRADFLGAYGHRGNLSPRFDELAREGTLFENAFATSYWTVPSHASLFTGLHPISHGASFEHHRYLEDRFLTIAERLRDAGYQTTAFTANHYVEFANLHQGFERRRMIGERFQGLALRRLLEVVGFPAKWIDQGAADGVGQIADALAGEIRKDRPVFMFVNLLEPHWRYLPPLPDRRATLPDGLGLFTATRISVQFYAPEVMGGRRIEGPVREAITALYSADVRYQDRMFGRVIDLLRRHLDLDETLLIVTADHGENLGEAGRWDHAFALNDHLIRVPLLIRYPKRFPPGLRLSELCQLTDVTATITDVTGVEGLPGSQGRTLVPDAFRPREWIVAEGDPILTQIAAIAVFAGAKADLRPYSALLRAVRTERFKYVHSSTGPAVLHDLRKDADEMNDVTAAHPDVAENLRETLGGWLASQEAYRASPPAAVEPADPELQERLRALGYVQ